MIKRTFSLMRLVLSATLAFVALNGATTPRAAHAATFVVDDDGQATAANCDAKSYTFKAIQAAVNAAAPADTILICPGVYNEQVVVTKRDLTIRGAGTEVTVLRPTAVTQNTTSILLGVRVAPILLVDSAANVTIGGLTIDGSAADSGAILRPNCLALPQYVGIYYRNSSGTVATSHVTNITSATACTFAIRAESANLVVTNNFLDHYGHTGVACVGQNNTTCSITGNAIKGRGPVDNEFQAGIQIRAGAAGEISGNVITDHFLIGAKGAPQFSVGILLVFAQPSSNPHLLRDNVFVDNQANVQRFASAAAF